MNEPIFQNGQEFVNNNRSMNENSRFPTNVMISTSGLAYDSHSIGIHTKWQHPAAVLADRLGDRIVTAFAHEQDETTSATGAADLCSHCSLSPCGGNQLVDKRRRNSRRIGASELPFFTKQPSHFGPVARFESRMHRTGDFA